jgi:hypothetical protein
VTTPLRRTGRCDVHRSAPLRLIRTTAVEPLRRSRSALLAGALSMCAAPAGAQDPVDTVILASGTVAGTSLERLVIARPARPVVGDTLHLSAVLVNRGDTHQTIDASCMSSSFLERLPVDRPALPPPDTSIRSGSPGIFHWLAAPGDSLVLARGRWGPLLEEGELVIGVDLCYGPRESHDTFRVRVVVGAVGSPGDTIRHAIHPHPWHLLPLFAGVGAAGLAAPGLLVAVAGAPGPDAGVLPRRRVTVVAAWGYAVGPSAAGGSAMAEGGGFGGGLALEALVGDVVADVRFDAIRAGGWVRSARVGWLRRTGPGIAGGVSVGYREEEVRGTRGVEVGFPVLFEAARGFGQFEAAWLLAPGREAWGFRGEVGGRVPGSALIAGMRVEAREPVRGGGGSASMAGVFVGVRL